MKAERVDLGSAHVSRARASPARTSASRRNSFSSRFHSRVAERYREVGKSGTLSPARETHALPGL
jgi:hypothetical protein